MLICVEMQGPRDALLAIESGQVPSLLFTDVFMPEMSGRELVDRVKAMHPSLMCSIPPTIRETWSITARSISERRF